MSGDEAMAAAEFLGLEVPQACREGIARNMDLLKSHAAIVEAYLTQDAARETKT